MKGPRLFYGWYIVAASLIIITLDGLLLYTFGVYMPFLDQEFGLSRSEVSSIFAFRSLILAFSLVLAGRLVDRHDPRAVIFGGGLIAALGLLLSGFATEKWHIWMSYGLLIGLGDGVLYVTCVAVVSRWFVKKRALVIAIITTGMPISGFLYPPLAEWLITSFGVRVAFFALAALLSTLLLSSFVFRAYPRDMNLEPYGDEEKPKQGAGPENNTGTQDDWTAREVFKTPIFWLMYTTYAFGFMTFLIVVLHVFSYVIDSGLSTELAAYTLACIGIGSIVGRILISGYLTDVLRNERVLFLCYFFQGSSIFIALFVKEAWSFYIFGLLYGFFYSGWVPIFPNMLGNFFGLKALGTIYGFLGTSFSLAAIAGPMIAAYIFSNTGSYYYAFCLTIAFCYIAAFSTFLIKIPRKRQKTPALL
ncbi:MAG: MFS transporter [Thermodesulfobacteriota bacterium]